MDRLRVLAEVVKTGEAASAMTLERPFTSVFPVTSVCSRYSGFSPILTLCVSRDARFV